MTRTLKIVSLCVFIACAVWHIAGSGIDGTGTLPVVVLWGRDIHYRMTLRKAKEVGFNETESLLIAEACNAVDTSHKIIGKTLRNYWHHLDPFSWLPFWRDRRVKLAEYYLAAALATSNVKYLGAGLHSLQDLCAHHNIPIQRDLPWLAKYIGTWRDDPERNPDGAKEAEKATREYLQRYLKTQQGKDICRD